MQPSRIIVFSIFIFCIFKSSMAQEIITTDEEKWYVPVNIGQHMDLNSIDEDILSKTQGRKRFQKETLFTQPFLKQIEGERDLWLEQNNEKYREHFKYNKLFQIDKEHSVTVDIHGFSRTNIRLYVSFIYGHSRWHHYDILLKAFLIERDNYIDGVFKLKEQELRYSFTYNGVGHGTTSRGLEEKLGNDYVEYMGQSPQYRNIYYELHDIEVIIQDGIVKYLCTGRPDWMDSNMIQKQ